MKPIELRYGHSDEREISRYRLTAGKHFAVFRKPGATCIESVHLASGLRLAVFSHLSVRTLTSAVDLLNRVEQEVGTETLARLDSSKGGDPLALRSMRDAMRNALPIGVADYAA